MNLTDGQKQKAATHVSWWLTEEGKEVKREKRKRKKKEKKEREANILSSQNSASSLVWVKRNWRKTGLRGCFRLEQVERVNGGTGEFSPRPGS